MRHTHSANENRPIHSPRFSPTLTSPFSIPAENATRPHSWSVDRANAHGPQNRPRLAQGYPGLCRYLPDKHANGLSNVSLSETESDFWWRIRCEDKAGSTIGA